jgi:uncharacterized membrane protein (DUF485 family)
MATRVRDSEQVAPPQTRPAATLVSTGVADDAELEALASRRLRVALVLTGAMLVVYFGFILLIAFAKDFLAREITDGLTVGIALGVLVILTTWALTWTYVRWANRVYEPALARLRR